MNIGLVAHDSKKSTDAEFLYCLSRNSGEAFLYATGTTGRLIEEATSLNINKYIAGHLGGIQQIAAQIEHNQLDLMIFLRDPLQPKKHEPDIKNVFRLCDTYNVPLATNLATAEMLIKSLDRGELEWREMYR